MTTVGWLPAPVEDLFGTEATADVSYEVLTVDVPPASWLAALAVARDRLGCTYFDWLSAVDEPGTGFRVCAHVVALSPVRRLLVRTTVPHAAPTLPSAVDVYAGAAWHERETHEMFGVVFEGHPALDHLLLPENFEGHPLRKDFVLAARVAKAWPGAKEPGESEHGGPKRRQMLPPGVPDPNEWGPLKGQLPPAPTRPGRAAPGERPTRTPADRPPRRTRTASQGSTSQTPTTPGEPPAPTGTGGTPRDSAQAPTTPPRRMRSATEGSASQPAGGAPGAGPRRARTAADGSVSQATSGTGAAPGDSAPATKGPAPVPEASPPAAGAPTPETASSDAPTGASETPPTGAPAARRARSANEGSASQRPAAPSEATPEGTPSPHGEPTSAKPSTAPRSPDAPWHHARPAFDQPAPSEAPTPKSEPRTETDRPAADGPAPEDDPEDPAGGSQ
jgi:NADH:ubiquinone oxidoreductase subunit C